MRDIRTISHLQDRVNLAIGALLFLSPWLLGYTDLPNAATNAWLCGVAIAALATAALFSYSQWEQWYGIALGGWIVVAPWVLEFAAAAPAVAAHVVLGLLFIACEGWEIWAVRHPPRSAA